MCCCGPGHRCPEAWQLIRLAQRARERGAVDTLDAVRQTYSAHLRRAGLLAYPAIAHPDVCTITIDDDPRCPQCASSPDTEHPMPRSQPCAWCGHLNDETARWCPRCGHAAHLPRTRCNCLRCQSGVSRSLCCCMPEHHCPLAWELIELARSAEDMQILYLLTEVSRTYETHRRRAGLVTLLSRDWLDTLPPIPEADPRCPQCGTA